LKKNADEITREKKIWKMLIRDFWPKKNMLLGRKKEEVVEVKKGHA
jgi:hypothetical protein